MIMAKVPRSCAAAKGWLELPKEMVEVHQGRGLSNEQDVGGERDVWCLEAMLLGVYRTVRLVLGWQWYFWETRYRQYSHCRQLIGVSMVWLYKKRQTHESWNTQHYQELAEPNNRTVSIHRVGPLKAGWPCQYNPVAQEWKAVWLHRPPNSGKRKLCIK